MKRKYLVRTFIIILVLVSNLSCDQVSKSIVRKNVGYHEKIEMFYELFTLTKVENSGAFLSLGNNFPVTVKLIFLNLLPLLALFSGLIFLFVKQSIPMLSVIGLSFIIGGGLGNIYDRILYGSVTDFFHIDFVIFQTGIFNMADVSIMVGMALIVLQSFLNNKTTPIEESQEDIS
ncbi:MAG: signal peptidase II [Bacteroidota bacterium]|nr:signal peptidase II [Bacteroidota bacterium]